MRCCFCFVHVIAEELLVCVCAGRSAQFCAAQERFSAGFSLPSCEECVLNPLALCQSTCKAQSTAAIVSLECRLAGSGAYLYLPKKSSVVVKYPLYSLQLAVCALMHTYCDKPAHSCNAVKSLISNFFFPVIQETHM